jgi:predicted RNase H-like HicB family nuclease
MNKQQKTYQTKQTNKKIKIIIERTDNSFTSYAENVPGIYGHGDTIEDAKQSALKGIDLLKKYSRTETIPSVLRGDYKIVFKMDRDSLFDYFRKLFTEVGFQHITGMNQEQFQHYTSGLKKSPPAQIKKIETAIHKLGKELMSVEL